MNPREAPSNPSGVRQALHCLALLLLSGLAPESTLAGSRPRTGVHTIGDWRTQEREPYLAAIGAPALRFREPEYIPELTPRPVAIGPPVAGLSPAEAAVAVANAGAIRVPTDEPAKPSPAKAAKSEPSPAPVPAKPVPPAILPDDTRPQVRAEDFLPFFQVPASGPNSNGNMAPMPPGPAPLPPSSASYTQTPK